FVRRGGRVSPPLSSAKSSPHPSPLPEGEGADRVVWRYTST
ncbi:AraC family transcriptional regulator, partial [Pseudomonas sp. FW215-R2]